MDKNSIWTQQELKFLTTNQTILFLEKILLHFKIKLIIPERLGALSCKCRLHILKKPNYFYIVPLSKVMYIYIYVCVFEITKLG